MTFLYRPRPFERTLLAGVQTTDTTGFVSIGGITLNPADFRILTGVTWGVVLETTNAADAAEVRLWNVTTSAVISGSVLSTTSLTPVTLSASVTLTAGANIYEAQLRLQTTGSPNQATCKQAQLILATS